MVVVAEIALEPIMARVAHEIVNIYKRTIILFRGDVALCAYRRLCIGDNVIPVKTRIDITQLSPCGYTRIFSGFPQVHFGPGGVISGAFRLRDPHWRRCFADALGLFIHSRGAVFS